jgi:hypothetical protein
MRNVILIAAILTCFESVLLADHGSVPMTVEPDGIIAVRVLVNGQGPFPFVIDTGSNRSVVGASLARTLELPVVARTEVISVTGRGYRPVVRLSASIGASSPTTVLASIVPDESLAAATRGAHGMIGQDLLMTLNYTLDYARHQFVLSVSHERNSSSVELPLETEEGRVIVGLPPHRGQRAVRLVPDSGATTFVVFDRGAPSPFAMEPMSGGMRLGTATSTQHVPMVRLREVRLNTLTLRDQMAALVQRSGETGIEVDGLLPLGIFTRVAFDMERQRMIVTPRR